MRQLSGNYPEVWVGYKLNARPGTNWFIVQDVHNVDLAVEVFKKDPPHVPLGMQARVVKVHQWKSPKNWVALDIEDIPALRGGFVWPTQPAKVTRRS